MDEEGMTYYGHQVAGHGILHLYQGKIIKPLVEKEYQFYEKASQENPQLLSWLPHYYGSIHLASKEYIMIEDLLKNYLHPSIIDIKIGKKTFSDDCTEEKKQSMTKKALNSTTHNLGFRISGMKKYNSIKNTYELTDKVRSRVISATPESVYQGLLDFFSPLDDGRRQMLLEIIGKISVLLPLLQNYDLELYSSSLLIVYEDIVVHPTDSFPTTTTLQKPNYILKLIDFAHSKWTDNKPIPPDYLEGLSNLSDYLSRIYAGKILTEDGL